MATKDTLEAYGDDICCKDISKTHLSFSGGDFPRLTLRHVLGFNGKITNGLIVHPAGKHIIYAVGRYVIIEEIIGACPRRQEMLIGHMGHVTALAVSDDGQFIVSGQMNASRETRSPVILWEWCSRRKILQRNLHKEMTKALEFTSSSRYFVSLGGQDDGHICVWDTAERKAVVSKVAQAIRVGPTAVIKASHVDQSMFISVGESYGRIWSFDRDTIKLTFKELNFGSALRKVISAEIGDADNPEPTRIFCGTTTGSVLIFHGESGVLMTEVLSPAFPLGVTVLTYTRMLDDNTYCLLIGTGEGKVGYYTIRIDMKGHKCTAKMGHVQGSSMWSDPQVESCVTSISKLGVGQQFYVGLYQSHIHRFTLAPWGSQLVRTCSNTPINAVAFARDTDDLLVTGEPEKVRVFNLKVMVEVRRFVRSGGNCVSTCLRHDGTLIFTGWNSGDVLVLGFEPKGLGLNIAYRIDNAHRQAVSCMALTSTSDKLVTGGLDSFVSVWRLLDDLDMRGHRLRQGLRTYHFVDQKGPITQLRVSEDNQTCVASSLDGTCVAYSLATGLRLQIFTWPCGLNCITFCQSDLQIVTAASDGRLQWWDMVSGQHLREKLGSSSGNVRSTDTEPTCRQVMATGGEDMLVKLWHIEEGEVCYVGEGHSDAITVVKFGSRGSILLTASLDGSVCIWDVPSLK